MSVVIFFTLSKRERSKKIALEISGDKFEILPVKQKIKWPLFQMIYYGYLTVANKEAPIEPLNIDFDKYNDITLVSPVWGGQANAYMRQFLRNNPFKNKKVTIIGTCEGGYKKYFSSYKKLLDPSNEIINQIMYVKGEKV